MARPNIINHIIEDLDDRAADILESYLEELESEADYLEYLEGLIKHYREQF